MLSLVFNRLMSTEVNSLENQSEPSKVSHQQKVDINILLNKTHEMLSKNLVSSQKTSDTRCCQFLFLFLLFFTVFGRETTRAIYLGPVLYIKLGI